MTRRKITILATLLALLLGLGLKAHGYLDIVARIPSPNGRILTIVYEGSADHFYLDNDTITLENRGQFRGRTHFPDAHSIQIWWSPNSRYRVESYVQSGEQMLWLSDYKTNICHNLTHRLDMSIYDDPHFQDKKSIAYTIQGFDTWDNVLLVSYQLQRMDGPVETGQFWYDCDTGTASTAGLVQ